MTERLGVMAGAGVAIVVVGTLVAALVWSSGGRGDSRTGSPPASDSPEPQQAEPAKRLESLVRPERPTSARLPSGAVVPIRAVETTPSGRLDVPDDIRSAGWWRGGSRIGDPFGSTLLAAHIDSTTQGLGPYAELLRVRPHQRVVVSSKSLRQTFEIRSLRLVDQGPLTDQRWIFSAKGERRLTLVTCAPPYDASAGGYQNLAVVTAIPVSAPVRRAG